MGDAEPRGSLLYWDTGGAADVGGPFRRGTKCCCNLSGSSRGGGGLEKSSRGGMMVGLGTEAV